MHCNPLVDTTISVNPDTACLAAAEILACLLPIFQSIREKAGFVQAIGFLHPVAEGRVTLSAHGCVAHSWTRRITSSAVSSRTSSVTDLSRKISAHFHSGNRSNSDLAMTPDRKSSAPAHLSGFSTLPRVRLCCCGVSNNPQLHH